jgi:hypothetical protein
MAGKNSKKVVEEDEIEDVGYIAMDGMLIFHCSSFVFFVLVTNPPSITAHVPSCRCPFTGTVHVPPFPRACLPPFVFPSRCSDIAATVTENEFPVLRNCGVNITSPFLRTPFIHLRHQVATTT